MIFWCHDVWQNWWHWYYLIDTRVSIGCAGTKPLIGSENTNQCQTKLGFVRLSYWRHGPRQGTAYWEWAVHGPRQASAYSWMSSALVRIGSCTMSSTWVSMVILSKDIKETNYYRVVLWLVKDEKYLFYCISNW